MTYLYLRDWDRAFEYLEKALSDQEFFLSWLRFDLSFDPLRSDPRYARLLSEIHLSDTEIQRHQSVPFSQNR
jgi:hypothetical protein